MHVNGRRVVVTGLGAVSPLGLDALSFWDALVAGRSGISHLTTVDPGDTGVSIAGQIEGFEARRFVDGRTARLIDRAALLFAAASDEALRDARLDPRGRDVAVVAGVDTALATTARIATGFHTQGQLGVDAYALVQALPNTASGLAARRLGIRGPHLALSAACAGGAVAALYGGGLIRLGEVDAAIVGGSVGLDPVLLAACVAARVLSRSDDPARASRPFDRRRDGFVVGEGSGALVLEELAHARRRGATVHAELLGGAQTSSLEGYTINDAQSCAACMSRALASAGVTPDDVDLVSAHAPSTPLGDRQEAEALDTVFGRRVPAFAAKGSLGHCMAATAALETIAAVRALEEGVAPPTLNYEEPDPECQVDCVPNVARPLDVGIVLKNAFGFGGVNCCLVLGRPPDDDASA